ncbi:hypothetical protein TELCIR_19864, partial [Teladorsagia circumcincta]
VHPFYMILEPDGKAHGVLIFNSNAQISRWGYKDFDELKKVVSRNINAGVPLEVVVFDIDYMDRYKDFTLNPVCFAMTYDVSKTTSLDSAM